MATALPSAPFASFTMTVCEFCGETHLVGFEDPKDTLAVMRDGCYPCEECACLLEDIDSIVEMVEDGTAERHHLEVLEDLNKALANRTKGKAKRTAPHTFN